MVADPHALAERAADPMVRSVAQLVQKITATPWRLGPADRSQAHAAGLSDEVLFQVVLLSSFFGHLNRIADAVGVELDYSVVIPMPHAEPATPPYLRPDRAEWPVAGPHPLSVDLRPSVVAPLAAWRSHALLREDPLDRRPRAVIACAVAVPAVPPVAVPVRPRPPCESPEWLSMEGVWYEVAFTLVPSSLSAGVDTMRLSSGLLRPGDMDG